MTASRPRALFIASGGIWGREASGCLPPVGAWHRTYHPRTLIVLRLPQNFRVSVTRKVWILVASQPLKFAAPIDSS